MLQTGTLLRGRFLIEQELARGGMGAVYLATDQKFGSRVAIKERIYEQAELAAAFEREARLLNSLHHPILPHVSDYFSEDGGHFLVMEYIEGTDISEILRTGGVFQLDDVLKWADELLEGVDFLHSLDPPVIHRDIKPGNLKLTNRGNIVLLDFGLAKETSGNTQGVRSVFGYSRRYSPLEQIEGAGTDERSDIFSLGATLYHLITCEAPADVLARASAIVAGRRDPLRSASEIRSEVSPAVAEVLNCALSLAPEKRFKSAALMRSALKDAVNGRRGHVGSFAAMSKRAIVAGASPSKVIHAADVSNGKLRSSTMTGARSPERLSVLMPWFRRPVFIAMILFAALLAIGFARLGARLGSDDGKANDEQPVAEATTTSISMPESPSTVELATPTTEATNVKDESHSDVVASMTDEVDRPPIKRTNEIDGSPGPRRLRNEENSSAPVRKRVETRDETSLTRTPERDRFQDRPRRIIRRQPVEIYRSPVSSIEMIFTGISPDQKRRMRRYQPY